MLFAGLFLVRQMLLNERRQQLLEELLACAGFLGDSQSLNETSRVNQRGGL